ncbi:MAG: hypothetical protein ACO1QS_18545, partial [Verrucomicrobiota bacterium]
LFASCVVLLLVVIVKPGSEEQMGLAKLSESAPPAAGAELAPTSPQPSADALAAAPAASPVAMPQTVPEASLASFERAELPSKNISATPPRPVGTVSRSALPSVAKEMKANEAFMDYAATPKPAPAIVPAAAPVPASSVSVAMSLPAEPRGGVTATPQPELKMKRMQEAQFSLDATAGAPPAPTAPSATAATSTEARRAKLTIVQSNSLRMDTGSVFYTTTLADPASSNAAGQRFVQTPSRSGMRRNYQSPPSPEIMDQFQVQQNGEEVKITDSDGSVYVGNMLPPEEERATALRDQTDKDAGRAQMKLEDRNRVAAPAATRGALSAPASSGNATRSFRATGLNRTLNQPVVIDGAFFESVPPALSGGVKAEALKKDAAKTAPPQPQLQIQGRVQVGDRQELIINAVPVNR